MQEKTENELKELKQIYEAERHKLEKRLSDEKSKYDIKFNQIIDEYEQKYFILILDSKMKTWPTKKRSIL
jgi:hypothetical protein